jgi:N-acyl-D-aspartate/D-glutamate deacylase
MTWLPAELMGIRKRGKIEEGYYADITVFDPQTIADTATFAVPRSSPIGIEAVVVNGVLAFSNGVILNKSSGRLLTKN